MRFSATLVAITLAATASAQDLPLFDSHIHYSHDAVDFLPPEAAAQILRDAGLKSALVSSSNDNGTQAIYAAAPDIVVPALRPYQRRGTISTWMYDEGVIDYVEDRLSKFEYRALGEFHAFGDDIKLPVLQRMIELAKEYDLILHAHSDADAINLIFEAWPEAKVLWAHSGFLHPRSVAETLRKHDNLWADLAFRSEIASGGEVDARWREAFDEFPDRFMVGTDTFAPERWYYVEPHAADAREWLATLPEDLARAIAFENADNMLALIK